MDESSHEPTAASALPGDSAAPESAVVPAVATAATPAEPPLEERSVDPALKPIAAWIGQLARTLKTCRLYHPSNPTVIRFRAELFEALTRLTAERGALTYRFTADDVLFDEVSLYP